ncbi:MAG: helix-turn-helix domain-containing protein [Lutibacter sp.]
MPREIITTDDLREFKIELLDEIKKLLKTSSTAGTKKYLKSAEMMKLLNVSSGTLQTLRINGTLPYTKIGGIIFYNAEEIYKVMEENSIHNKF